jgi:Stigma-specific protein, Stig1
MPLCPRCGSPAGSGDVFCRSCGVRLNGEAPVTPRSPLSPPVTSRAESLLSPSARSVPSPVRPDAQKFLSPVQVLGLIGMILILAAAAFFVFSGSPLPAGIQNSTGLSRGTGTLPVNGQCPAGMSLCSGKCVNLQTDPDNCGACGFSVPYGETCRNGKFSSSSGQRISTTPAISAIPSVSAAGMQGSCPSGRSSCSGTCRDLLNDAANCGSCGNSCPPGQNCLNGRCFLQGTSPVVSTSAPVPITPELSCSGGQTPCSGSCVDLFSDKKNCGVCGRACKSQEICVNAQCGPACTKSGTTLCDDVCVDLDTDTKNCGACGTECRTLLPNAKGSVCTDGKCVVSQCDTDYGDCNEKVSDGCEVNLRLDAGNCGSCGVKCPSGQVCYNKKCSKPIGT